MKRINDIPFRNKVIAVGMLFLPVAVLTISFIINSTTLSDRSRASGTDLNVLSFDQRAAQITGECAEVKGYLARTEISPDGKLQYDRFSGRYYSLDKTNPAVTPLPDRPLTAYCRENGTPDPVNWCKDIPETGCLADCIWISGESCGVCAPYGVDSTLICRP